MRACLSRRVAVLLALVPTLLLIAWPADAADRKVPVTLMVLSDIYEIGEKGGRGGFARAGGAIAIERASRKHVIVAHAGDTFSPSLISGFDKGASILELTNMIAPDVFAPGNHEFDFGEAVFLERLAGAKFPMLAANLRAADGNPVPGIADTKMFELDGVKIGVVGLTDEDSAIRSSPGSLKFLPMVKTAEAQTKALREAGADLVVLVVHAPWQTDLRLFSSGKYDVILSGHDHDLLVAYDGRTAIAEPNADGETLVAIDLEITVSEGDSRRVTWHPRFRVIDTADVTPNAAIAARVAEMEKDLAKDLDVVIGKSETALDSRKAAVRSGETAIGNLITDAMREATKADVAIVNGGGIRGDREYPAGSEITRRDVFKELPFGNKVMVIELTGAQLKAVLENGVWAAGKAEGRFGHLSGVKLVARKDAIPGQRITSVEVGGVPLDPAGSYKVATNDFLAAGKDGFGAFLEGKVLLDANEGPLLAGVVMNAIEAKGTIAPGIEGRIVLE